MGIDYIEISGYFIKFNGSECSPKRIYILQGELDPNEDTFEYDPNINVIIIKQYSHFHICRYDGLAIEQDAKFEELQKDQLIELSSESKRIVDILIQRLPDAKLIYGKYSYISY